MTAHWARAGAAIAATVLFAAACKTGGGGTSAQPSRTLPPMAPSTGAPIQSHYMSWPNKMFRVDLMGLDRITSGRIVARFNVTSVGGSTADPTAWAASDDADDAAPTGAVLIDPVAGMEYRVLQTTTGSCLCTVSRGISAGKTASYDVTFPAPSNASDPIIVVFPNTPPFFDVPVKVHSPYSLYEPAGATPMNPATATTASPRAYALVNTVEHGKETDATSNGRENVRLSNDVVFGYNSATLTASAKSLLAQVAGQIDKSTSNTVTVYGYTDNTGNNAVNVPLSQRRAQAVVNQLKNQVTRKGITYSAKGFGSADPIAPNSSASGRSLNRRVVISFTAPATSSPSTTNVPHATGDPASLPSPPAIETVHATAISLIWPKSLEFSVDGLIRDPNGYATLIWTFHNDSHLPEPAGWATDLAGIFRTSGPSRIALLSGQDEFKNVEDSQEYAVFPSYSVSLGDFTIKGGKNLVGWNFFKLPAGVSSVAVTVPGFPMLKSIHVDGLP